MQHSKAIDTHVPSGTLNHNPQTHTLDRADTGLGFVNILEAINDHSPDLLTRH